MCTVRGIPVRLYDTAGFRDLSESEIKHYINSYLPDDICIEKVAFAGERFHSRYNATGKTYRYTCYVGDEKPIFDRKYVYTLELKK